ncbi:MAG TPA: hypothetical protein DEP78_14815 [Verrucomicrobiales bacterium]|nr:hypothetical protein [Pedosphaera sp.]MAN30547.1 hypothetical protein [Pedosphaera sp.]HBF03301.1 hypothetical protein [Verrucomicrobiales bacterium]HCB99537.1 hypothetical protein [Verrucomicrobiales bacterium]HCQ84136.1 hypothetical protein [Verrucomicrobiales bacterium]
MNKLSQTICGNLFENFFMIILLSKPHSYHAAWRPKGHCLFLIVPTCILTDTSFLAKARQKKGHLLFKSYQISPKNRAERLTD